jgi:hypothetical protein
MTNDPTPFDRLIRLEKLVADLRLRAGPPQPPSPIEHSLLERHQWPADELLLTRLIRRSPEALKAYEAPAELTQTDSQGVLLKAISGSSPFRLCELTNGDAVVWLSPEHETWIYDTAIFRCLFNAPPISDKERTLVLQSLPRFVRKVQGREWTLESSGEMLPKDRPFVEKAEQAKLELRIQKLEQFFARMRGSLDAELVALRSKVQLLQDQLDRLLRLQDNDLVP